MILYQNISRPKNQERKLAIKIQEKKKSFQVETMEEKGHPSRFYQWAKENGVYISDVDSIELAINNYPLKDDLIGCYFTNSQKLADYSDELSTVLKKLRSLVDPRKIRF